MTARRNKIGLVGSGMIGANLALMATQKHLGDVVMFDVVKDMPQGKALDLNHQATVDGSACHVTGSNDYTDLDNCDVVIVTAGITRSTDGQWNRDGLLETNSKIIKEVAGAIKEHCSSAFVIVITNPLDAMVLLMQKESGLPPQKVVGMAGVLDSARFEYFLSQKLKVSVEDVAAIVMGGHGDTMIALPRFCSVRGIPLSEFVRQGKITEKEIEELCERTRNGGAEIVQLLKQGSAFFAPARSAIQMAQAYLCDEKRFLPCAAYLSGQYDVKGLYVGVPAIIGGNGVEEVIQLELIGDERVRFDKSVAAVRELCSGLGLC